MIQKKLDENVNIAVIGLGYVGLPLAVEFSKKYNTIGFDLDRTRVKELSNGFDRTNEISEKKILEQKSFKATSDKSDIKKSNIYIVTVPTPVDRNNSPDLEPLLSASAMVGELLIKNDLVIFESTVFPGCTEQVCVPVLEEKSNLVYNKDFFCGYSPERINPGDSKYGLTNITKVVSGSNNEILDAVNSLYESIIPAGTFKVSSIAVAEASKVIENTQRDVNIALINEFSIIFDKLNINTNEVLKASGTKWNFLPFKPGLVGGHCIGVDPYYLTHKAMEVGYHPEIILAGRKINDNMGIFIADKTISELAQQNISPLNANITILGLSFKENCPDIRNTKVVSIMDRLEQYGCQLKITDPMVIPEEAKNQYDIDLENFENISSQDAIILAVCHDDYIKFSLSDWDNILIKRGVVIDVKSVYSLEYFNETQIRYWSL